MTSLMPMLTPRMMLRLKICWFCAITDRVNVAPILSLPLLLPMLHQLRLLQLLLPMMMMNLSLLALTTFLSLHSFCLLLPHLYSHVQMRGVQRQALVPFSKLRRNGQRKG